MSPLPIAFFVLLSSLVFNPKSFAGTYVGNGGDAILCQKSPENDLSGYYSLDYVLTREGTHSDTSAAQVSSWNDSVQRLSRILREKVPALADSFKEFSSLVYNTNYAELRVWEKAPFGLVDLPDERMVSLVPENCKVNGRVKIVQAVVREYEGFSGTSKGHYIYKYFPDLLADLDRQSPLQLSFLLVHEWLWDISSNVERNRRINHFLHSKLIESMSSADVVATLKGMGLYLPDKLSDNFDPASCQGYPLTKKALFKKFTGTFTLAKLSQLTINQRERILNCNELPGSCNPNWKEPHFKDQIWLNNRFFLAASWSPETGRDYPIKIISPELTNKSGTPFVPGVGQIACRYVDQPGANLECQIKSTDLIYPLFGISSFDTPYEKWPVMSGLITEECVRFSVSKTREDFGIGPDSRSLRWRNLIETVLSSRITWNP